MLHLMRRIITTQKVAILYLLLFAKLYGHPGRHCYFVVEKTLQKKYTKGFCSDRSGYRWEHTSLLLLMFHVRSQKLKEKHILLHPRLSDRLSKNLAMVF